MDFHREDLTPPREKVDADDYTKRTVAFWPEKHRLCCVCSSVAFLRSLLVTSTVVYYLNILGASAPWTLRPNHRAQEQHTEKMLRGKTGGSFAGESNSGESFLLASFLVDVYQHHKTSVWCRADWQLLRQNVLKLEELRNGMSGLRRLATFSGTRTVFSYTLSLKC